MGLSSSKTKTTSNTSQNSNQNETGTTTPITPDWLSQAAQDYVGRIGAFGDMDPNSFVAPAAPLQQMAWQNAGSLGDWRGQAATAAQMAQSAGSQAANLAGPGGAMGRYAGAAGLTPNVQMNGGGKVMPAHPGQLAPPINAFSGASAQQPAGAFNPGAQQQGPAYQAQASGYNAPQLGQASLVSGQGYSAPTLGNAQGYAAARVGAPIGAAASSYNPALVGAATIDPVANANATNAGAASLLDNLAAYQNPYTQQVVNASLADYDQQVARSQAALEAQGARNGAFGGSRFGIAQGQLLADQDRGRATLESGLLDQGFNAAAGLSQSDAANRQQSDLFNAQNRTGVSLANAGAANARDLAQAQLSQAGSIYNADAANNAGQFGANAFNQASQYNAGQANQMAATQAGLDSAASQFGAEQGNNFALQQAAMLANAGQYNAGAANQANLANQAAQNQYGLAQADLSQAAGQFNAGALNQASQFNAGANNQMSQFNASQQDAALARQLQAAGMLGSLANDYGSGTRADLGTMAQLGDQQRAIEQAYAMAGPAQLQLMGQLSGMTPYDILVGRQSNSNTTGQTTGTGTQTVTQSPSLFSQLLAAGQLAASFIP